MIVTWNSGGSIEKCLQSLFLTKADFEFAVFVVDNNSEDETVGIVREKFPQVHLIENEANYGFSKAANQIIRQVETDKVLLLDPCVALDSKALKNTLSWMKKNKQATVVTCGLLDDDCEAVINYGNFPGFLDLLGLKKKKTGEIFYKPSKIDFATKDFFLINKENVRDLKFFGERTLPEFDDKFFLGQEDIDYCQQVKKACGEVWFLPEIVGRTQGKKQASSHRKQKKANRRKSKYEYYRKWHNSFGAFLIKIFGK